MTQIQAEISSEAQAIEEMLTASGYSKTAIAYYINKPHMGQISDADITSQMTGTCGDTMEMFLKFENNRVVKASFTTTGCGPSAICGSFGAEAAVGREPEEVADITGETILEMAGGMPEDSVHCAYLAADALRAALEDYIKNRP